MSLCHPSPKTPALRDELAFHLERAYEHAGRPSASEPLCRCQIVLEALPITTTEYSLLRNRLRNAERYSMQREKGAARFEIRQCLCSLGVSM
jgi:hypothetical protein